MQERIALLFSEFDTDDSGQLQHSELVSLLELLQRLSKGEQADQNFEDQGHSNLDGHADIRQKVDALLLHLDADRDGKLSLAEFSLGIRSYPELAALFERYELPDEKDEETLDSPSRSGETQQKRCLSQCSVM